MARSKDTYPIEVHYPEKVEDVFEIRRKMGAAYIQFVKDYILTLPLSDEEKNKLYEKISAYLFNNK